MKPRTIFLLILAIELLSFTAYFFPPLQNIGFFLIIIATLVASLFKLEYGLYAAIAELIIGGMGYLFSFPIGPTNISLRLGIFVIIMAVWLAKMLLKLKIKDFQLSTFNFQLSHWWFLFGLAIVWGMLIGYLRHNNFGNLFLDANGFFYAALILPFIWCFKQKNSEDQQKLIKQLGIIFFTATTWLALKTLFSIYLFTHAGNNFIAANLLSYYKWIRDTGVGEITSLNGNFVRVFFQSHIYNIVAFFILLSILIYNKNKNSYAFIYDRSRMRNFILGALNASIIIVSFSRSFWLGVFCGLVVFGGLLIWKNKGSRWRALGRYFTILFTTLIFAVLFLIIATRFPIPKSSPLDLSLATKTRFEYEVAASSRWNLLPPLWQAIKKHPILGSGFGTTVTYISNDPRVREQSPTGLYTTYAFEWGWLDLWLKLGLVGMILYLILLFQIYKKIWLMAIDDNFLRFGYFSALTALIILNFFTPYLNHPLGFGILILLSIVANPSPLMSRWPYSGRARQGNSLTSQIGPTLSRGERKFINNASL